ncbi:MAG: hypothetical protein PHU85_16340 [Phycisphaerae bacterium]|nr:hypothetical protein [Phycisphaerae bacterium]
MVRFGARLLAKAEVEKRMATAADLLRKADAEPSTKDALVLYKQAADQHPYWIDIPLHKSRRLADDSDGRAYGLALGEVLQIEPTNVMALNNSGVLALRKKNYAQGIKNLARAAILSEDEAILDNLILAVYLNRYASENGHTIVFEGYAAMSEAAWKERVHRTLAAMETEGDVVLGQAFDLMHKTGRRVDQRRWGAQWTSIANYKATASRNSIPLRQARALAYRVRAIEARNDKTGTMAVRMEYYERIVGLSVPTYPGVLTMIDEAGRPSSRSRVPEAGMRNAGEAFHGGPMDNPRFPVPPRGRDRGQPRLDPLP